MQTFGQLYFSDFIFLQLNWLCMVFVSFNLHCLAMAIRLRRLTRVALGFCLSSTISLLDFSAPWTPFSSLRGLSLYWSPMHTRQKSRGKYFIELSDFAVYVPLDICELCRRWRNGICHNVRTVIIIIGM